VSDDVDAIINQLIDWDIAHSPIPEERDYLQQLKHSPDELIRLFYARKVAALQLAARKEQVDDDTAVRLGIVSSANIAKLQMVRKLEGVMHIIDARIAEVDDLTFEVETAITLCDQVVENLLRRLVLQHRHVGDQHEAVPLLRSNGVRGRGGRVPFDHTTTLQTGGDPDVGEQEREEINRPTGKGLGEVLANQEVSKSLADVPVHYGGPVQPNNLLIAVFQQTGAADKEVSCTLNSNLEQAEAFLQDKNGWVRAFVGYSGWGEGQLEGELATSSWKVCPPDPELFDERLLSGLWSFYVTGDTRWRSLLPHLPKNPGQN